MNEQLRRRILSMTCIIGFFVAWELLCLAFHVPDIVLPRPSQILVTLWTPLSRDLAARAADALYDAGRIWPRHRDRHSARHADRLLAARL